MDWTGIAEQLQQVISEPTSNLAAASLMLAAVTLFILIIIIGLAFFVMGGSPAPAAAPKKKPARERDAEQTPESKRRKSAFNLLVFALVAGAVVVAYAATGSDSYCADTCHGDQDIVVLAASDVHAGVPCSRCHEDPVPLGIPANLGTRARHLVAEVTQRPGSEGGRAVPARACLACHRDIATGTAVDSETGVVMAHEQPLEAGMSCSDCHVDVGHGEEGLTRGMTTCLSCHDGEMVSAQECSECHESDTALAASDTGRFFGQTRVFFGGCKGCHALDSCDDCHGLRMPHNQDFLGRGHARFAGFDKKELCYRCHAQADCRPCHFPFEVAGHASNWFTDHQRYPRDSACSCHQWQVPSDRPFCEDCH